MKIKLIHVKNRVFKQFVLLKKKRIHFTLGLKKNAHYLYCGLCKLITRIYRVSYE